MDTKYSNATVIDKESEQSQRRTWTQPAALQLNIPSRLLSLYGSNTKGTYCPKLYSLENYLWRPVHGPLSPGFPLSHRIGVDLALGSTNARSVLPSILPVIMAPVRRLPGVDRCASPPCLLDYPFPLAPSPISSAKLACLISTRSIRSPCLI